MKDKMSFLEGCGLVSLIIVVAMMTAIALGLRWHVHLYTNNDDSPPWCAVNKHD